MLGALFTLIFIVIIRWYVELMKKFKKFIKTGTEFSAKQLVCLLFTNFLVVGFTSCVILILFSELSLLDEEIWTIGSMVISLLIAAIGDYFIYRKYAQLKCKNLSQNSSVGKGNIESSSFEFQKSLQEEGSSIPLAKSTTKKYNPVKLFFNVLFLAFACTALVVSIIFFARWVNYYYGSSAIAIVVWLLTSLFASGAVCVWYYLNKSHISKSANKILGIIFFILGVAGCVSPFFSVASLYVAAMSLKNIFSYSEDEDIIILTEPVTADEWPLRDFVKTYGPKIKLANLSHKSSGEEFKAVMVGDDGNWIIIKFSKSLPVLTAKEIAQQANELKVVLLDTKEYILCRI